MYGSWVTNEISTMATYFQRDAYKGIGCSRAVREQLQIAAGDDPKEAETAGEKKDLYGVDVVLEKAEKFYTDWARNVKAETDAQERKRLEASASRGGHRKSALSRAGKKR